jgi:hypothetical protein
MVGVLPPEAVGIVVVPQDTMELAVNVSILNKYIMFGRDICEKYQSRDEKFPEPI